MHAFVYQCLIFFQDTATELKQVKEKSKENERHNEFLKNECKRLNEDLNEAILRSEALEIQLETLSTTSRNQISEKDVSSSRLYFYLKLIFFLNH